jgi:hypothetical protein
MPGGNATGLPHFQQISLQGVPRGCPSLSPGVSIAIVAILADLERFAIMLFFPYYVEFLLKARGRPRPEWPAKKSWRTAPSR